MPEDPPFAFTGSPSTPLKEQHERGPCRLCEKHFHPSDFVTSTSYTDTVIGKVIEVPLKLRRLKPGTVPSIFPGCPTYLSQDKSAAREGPEKKGPRMKAKALQGVLQESLITQQEEEQSNAISSLEDLLCHMVGDFWSKVIVKDKVTRYCIEELGFLYVLLGKFQTDCLEDRFGKYRQLSGARYHASIRQIYESELVLRLQKVLKLPELHRLDVLTPCGSLNDPQYMKRCGVDVREEDIKKKQPATAHMQL
ncbi:hypothetical protein HPB52_011005 [Rhipicephalus sanguineus]|uniref:Uncharacterized protein n=1 Tax=Rhipicephalus sanguineus TaxID=34632 RepID=A0A9D4T7H5_RHISA|nr:hypothetical protein HPB52_011005 [Rhipicephalus sanguineus]